MRGKISNNIPSVEMWTNWQLWWWRRDKKVNIKKSLNRAYHSRNASLLSESLPAGGNGPKSQHPFGMWWFVLIDDMMISLFVTLMHLLFGLYLGTCDTNTHTRTMKRVPFFDYLRYEERQIKTNKTRTLLSKWSWKSQVQIDWLQVIKIAAKWIDCFEW